MKFKFIALAGLIFCIGCGHSQKKTEPEINNKPATVTEKKVDSTAVAQAPTREQLEKLKGRWQRTDGGYVMQILSVSDNGTMSAEYFNPKSIHVENAQWIFRQGVLYIRVILRDVNYPGSTYTLGYKADNDYLMGNYYQAVEGANYDVIFTREK
jgi:hypothetical protein